MVDFILKKNLYFILLDTYTCFVRVGTAGSLSSNLAFQKPTWQISTDAGGLASRAVDGCRDPTYFHGCCTHTRMDDYVAWGVGLGYPAQIYLVDIYTRNEGE